MEEIVQGLHGAGYVHVPGPMTLNEFNDLSQRLGYVVARERIALRERAHAYVAKPGVVPLHTDQPQVEVIGWWCLRQDANDGASHLLDGIDVVKRLEDSTVASLRRTRLACPAVAGGPPRTAVSVLRHEDGRDKLFCSPWLEPVGGDEASHMALRQLWHAVGLAAAERLVQIRLAPGDALFIDNQRMLHGRDAIASDSRRALHRVWIIDPARED